MRVAMALSAAIVLAALTATSASATTVTLGPTTLVDGPTTDGCGAECTAPEAVTVIQASGPGITTVAPSAGRIKAWRVLGTLGNMGTLKLQIVSVNSLTTTSVTAPGPAATNIAGQPNPVDVPIAAGQSIGLSLCRCVSASTSVELATVPGANVLRYANPGFTTAGQTLTAPFFFTDRIYQFNADVVLAPIVSTVSPATGAPAGGTPVTIAGQYLDGATGVSFGGVSAQSFTVNSPTSITAVSPPGAEFTSADVTVTGPGGVSPPSPTAKFGYKTQVQVPDTKISLSKVKVKDGKGKAAISFEAIGEETGFECALTKGKKAPKFKACKSPMTYKKLKKGKYTFSVRALNAAGTDPTPATKKIKIK